MHPVLEFDLTAAAAEIAKSLKIEARQVKAAVELLDAGNTIPFIARYRKEATKGLDEIALRAIEDLIGKARELCARKNTILKSIHEQSLLTDELQKQIIACTDLQTLEALYLPFKPKRRTRATIARERGLQPLADILLKQAKLNTPKKDLLRKYVQPNNDVPDEEAALAGALDIVAETWADDAETRVWLVEQSFKHGRISSQVKRGKKEEADKFEMYTNHSESVSRVPSHRFLAMQRGEDEGILRLSLDLENERVVGEMEAYFLENPQFEFYRELKETVKDCFERLLHPVTQSSVFQTLKERADEEAIGVFGKNLRELLLAPPAGPKVTLGIDPGFRTGCKLAVVDGTGQFLAHNTIYPTPPSNDKLGATKTLLDLIHKYKVELIAIGNGTASRETDAFVSDVIREHKLSVTKVMVSEAGASVYSASELAAKEYPQLDVTVRGAISIAHRLQDPLSELVKTDPKSIGVGQYQHDVNQTQLRKCLEREVESCVNKVGVDLNTASAALLSYVSGIGPKLAENIVQFRNENGPFRKRQQLTKVPKLGAKAFEQSAGFLRIRNGDQPLDNSAVHPESYGVVEKMAAKLGIPSEAIVGNATLVQKLTPQEFVNAQFGLPTVMDILEELSKPGRDPRKEFYAVKFSENANSIEDLKVGMVLEGVVTNVTHFGAFVDIGVHQDGLIHISQLSNTFVKDPNEIVSVGNVVKVKVLEVDANRKRISLTRKF
ncbi:MAG: RNA-binding transcriptional accessory protein [Planctomycetaceae bacterium]|nr:RNA-binding transcriptional accessory protein [Planctomycetaceae bacterium]